MRTETRPVHLDTITLRPPDGLDKGKPSAA
jgi:hypothetical protein